MKYLQLFENFKQVSSWRVGDIIYSAMPDNYYSSGLRLRINKPYEIVEIGYRKPNLWRLDNTVKVKDLDTNIIFDNFLLSDKFITEEEWDLMQKRDKFNI